MANGVQHPNVQVTRMTNLIDATASSRTAAQFVQRYFRYLEPVLASIPADSIEALVNELRAARERQATVFITGNGGSAATASHMAVDLMMCPPDRNGRRFRVLALTDSTPILTAVGNDFSYADVFVKQLEAHHRSGDMLIVISASGNSPNVVEAAKWMRERRGIVCGLLGFDGGRLKPLCDVPVHVQTQPGEYGPVEDAHLVLEHAVTGWLRHQVQTGDHP
jgi:D-sedoheptulose 7-phosphate isomerase